MSLIRALRAVLVPVLLLGAASAPAQDAAAGPAAVRAQYAKREVQIPMRDGVKLFTAIYTPKDTTRTYPFLLQRTPYSVYPYGADAFPEHLGPSAPFQKEGFIFVYQDVRGRMMSEGEFVNMRPQRAVSGAAVDESTDTYDTIEWLLKHVGNNGRVGQWGISYPGFYTAVGMRRAIRPSRPCRPRPPSWTGSRGTTSTATGPCGCPTPSTSW